MAEKLLCFPQICNKYEYNIFGATVILFLGLSVLTSLLISSELNMLLIALVKLLNYLIT